MLELITFTGIDARTDPGELAEIAGGYPRAEFAVLAGTHSGQDDPRFPPLRVATDLRDRMPRTALHLCGSYARDAAGPGRVTGKLLDVCDGFGRIQVNILGAAEIPRTNWVDLDALAEFAEWAPTSSVILQHRGPWDSVPLVHPRLEYLQDTSGGRGLESIRDWPPPPGGTVRVGYAGGLGPGNIRSALEFTDRHQDARTWLDMQAGIRTDNWLDLHAVREVCRHAWGEAGQ